MDLFELAHEILRGIPSTYSKDKKKQLFDNAVSSDKYLASEKRDGHYHRFVKQNDCAKIQSRGISTITNTYGDHSEHVPHIFSILNDAFGNDTLLIGEMYIDGKKDRDMTSIFGCLPNKAVERQKSNYGMVHYMIYDVWFLNGEDLMKTPFENRVEILETQVKPKLNCEYINIAEYFVGDEISDRLAEILARGGEGIVMTNRISFPSPGSRTAQKTIKIKAELEEDIDVFFTGESKSPERLYTGKEIETWQYWEDIRTRTFIAGQYFHDYVAGATIEPVTKNYFNRWPGSLEIGVYRGSDIFILGYVSGLTEAMKQDFYANPEKYRIKPCRVTCMEFTPDKQLRHPKLKGIREDISAEECTFAKIFGTE